MKYAKGNQNKVGATHEIWRDGNHFSSEELIDG